MKILFVEDSGDDALLTTLALERAGLVFSSALVASREGVVEALQRESWSAVVSDYNIPGFSGIEALHIVREHDPYLPFILLSATIGEERAVDVIRAGANDYVMKDHVARLPMVLDREVREAERRREHRMLEQLLRSHKEQLAEAQKIALIGSWVYDFRTRHHLFSDQLCRMFGFEPDHPLQREDIYAKVHPEDVGALREAESAGFADFQPFSVCFRVISGHEGGFVRTMEMGGRFVIDTDGQPLQMMVVMQDITDRVEREEELRRRAVQQAVVANLGQLALRGAPLESIFWEVAAFVCNVMEIELCEILRKKDAHFVMVEGAGWHPDPIGFEKSLTPGHSQASFTLEAGHPIVVEDIAQETRFVASELLVRNGVVSGITVPIASSDGEPWGILGAHSRTRRSFSTNDIDFLRAIATVMGQSIERSRADAELCVRTAQQSAIAELGKLALTTLDAATLDRACDLVVSALDVDHCGYARVVNGDTLVYRRWSWGADLPVELPLADTNHAGRSILTGQPVAIADYRAETSLSTAGLADKYGIVSGLAVPISGARGAFGALLALTRITRHFNDADRDFMQSVANILAEAMEREDARRALIDSEERYRSVVEGASEVIFTLASDGSIVSLNRAFETITGWRPEQWIGQRFGQMFEPGERERLHDVLRWMLESGLPANLEATLVADGRTILLEVAAFPRMVDGVVAGMYGFARDVTVARRVENERHQLTRSLELILESTIEGIYTLDVDGNCRLINGAAARMLGRTPDEIVGRNLHELVHARLADGSPFPQEDCPIQRVIVTGAPCTVTNDVFWRSDGFAVPVEYSAAPILDHGVAVGAVIAFTDVTERRKLELKLEQANRLSSLGRLAATVAHEFNNVLMGIAPFVELLRRNPARAESALDQIGRSVSRGKRITQDILRFTQPAEPVRAVFEVAPWLETVTVEAHSVLPIGYRLEVEIEDPHLRISADASQLHQIVMNLMLNARDAMSSGGTLTIGARRDAPDTRFAFGVVEHPERFVHFTVKDTGDGIPPEMLPHIFEPLFTTKKTGTGLGLTVTHQVVQHHGGEMFVESKVGEGTTFHIFIPIPEEAMELPQARGTADSIASAAHSGPCQVLLVEDDPVVAEGLRALLMIEGFAVDTVSTGLAAIASVRHARPDVVLLDVGLPDIEGTKVYTHLAEMYPTLPVVFSTGHADRARLDEYLGGSHVSCLLKPYESAVLLETLNAVLGA